MSQRAVTLIVAGIAASLVLLGACTSEEVARSPADTAPLYVAIGASDSVGTGARNPGTEGWVPVLQSKMPIGTRLMNLGIGGLSTRQAVDQVLPVAVDANPTVITVWLGVNDLANNVPLTSYRADLDALLGGLRGGTRARVFVANLPDLTLLPAFRERDPAVLRAEVMRWNDEIAAAVAANDAVLVDLFTGWAELRERRELIARDGLHPSTAGHRRLAEIFWQTISATGTGNREPATVGAAAAARLQVPSLLASGCSPFPVPCSRRYG